jgi:hypothetical protein
MYCTGDAVVLGGNSTWEVCSFLTKLLRQNRVDQRNSAGSLLSFVSWNKLPARAALNVVASTLMTFRTTSALTLDRHDAHTSLFLLRNYLDKKRNTLLYLTLGGSVKSLMDSSPFHRRGFTSHFNTKTKITLEEFG